MPGTHTSALPNTGRIDANAVTVAQNRGFDKPTAATLPWIDSVGSSGDPPTPTGQPLTPAT